jgi:hypothetical protein
MDKIWYKTKSWSKKCIIQVTICVGNIEELCIQDLLFVQPYNFKKEVHQVYKTFHYLGLVKPHNLAFKNPWQFNPLDVSIISPTFKHISFKKFTYKLLWIVMVCDTIGKIYWKSCSRSFHPFEKVKKNLIFIIISMKFKKTPTYKEWNINLRGGKWDSSCK